MLHPMSDQDIIDTIVRAVENWAEGRWHTIIGDVDAEELTVAILAGLRERYAIVGKP